MSQNITWRLNSVPPTPSKAQRTHLAPMTGSSCPSKLHWVWWWMCSLVSVQGLLLWSLRALFIGSHTGLLVSIQHRICAGSGSSHVGPVTATDVAWAMLDKMPLVVEPRSCTGSAGIGDTGLRGVLGVGPSRMLMVASKWRRRGNPPQWVLWVYIF